MFFKPLFCCHCIRRRRAGSTVSDRPSSERTLNGGQPGGQEGGEPPQEIELPNNDAAVHSETPQGDLQQGSSITSFPPFSGSPYVDNPSNDASQQDTPQHDTPQHDTPQQGSEPGSHSTATVQFPPYKDPMGGNQDTSSSSDGVPQANDTQTNEVQNSRDSQRDQEPKQHISQGERDVLDTMTLLG
ncbi:hypothetical protein FACUT_11497 [Fusarium acutatum]|uniref:Uncharacterized protein n=1 Tax=Fusarium acutatum TaxID=78861 RepID=A0A8H4NEJ7_9HYPO|nr:hypothetical protein FACUT_11497 [Fusarium acutatum]